MTRVAYVSAVFALALGATGCTGLSAVMQARFAAFEMSFRPTGQNRTVNACRAAILAEAAKLGAREVLAVAAGADHLNESGHFVGSVRTWVTYDRPSGYEVREATLTCVVDQEGRFINALGPQA